MKTFHVTFAAALLYCSTLSLTFAAKLPHVYPAELMKVIDGDTIKLRLELYPGLFKEVNLRIAGIDTPESRRGVKNGQSIAECEITLGKQTTAYAQKLLQPSQRLLVKNIDPGRTKYSRRINGELWFSEAHLQNNGLASAKKIPLDNELKNYGRYIMEQGMAVIYAGGARANWPCQDNPAAK